MNEFLSFRKMITPVFIQVIFWMLVGLCVILGLVTMTQGGVNFFAGLMMVVVGPLMIRIYCELLIVLFRIYDELVGIRTGAMIARAPGFPVIPTPATGGYPPSQDFAPPYAQAAAPPPVSASHP